MPFSISLPRSGRCDPPGATERRDALLVTSPDRAIPLAGVVHKGGQFGAPKDT